jgi:archaellum component FlaF (FlaF/FlaG flagellin family)
MKFGRGLFLVSASLLAIVSITTPTWAGFPPRGSSISIAITPERASFGNVAVGTSRSRTIKITNNGSVRVELNRLTVSGSGFTLANVPSSLTIAEGASVTFDVVFEPRSISSYSGSVPLVSGSVVMVAIPLSGAGVSRNEANVEITPSGASFGNVPVGTSNSQTIRIKNNGSVQIEFNRLAVSGEGFTLADVPADLSLSPASSITLDVVFNPRSVSKYSASVALVTTEKVLVASIPLSGTGVPPKVSLSANTLSLSFGDVGLGTKTSSSVKLTNNGNLNVTISRVAVTGSGFSVSGIASETVLKPGQSAALEAVFDPTTTGGATGNISIASNAPILPVISLSGTGVEPTASSVSLRWQAVSNVLGYFVYRGLTSGGPYTRLTLTVVSSLQYVDSTVIPGHTYYYVVTAVDSGNVQSSYSNQAEAPVPAAH